MACTFRPRSDRSRAAHDPTFPNPWTAHVALYGLIFNFSIAARVVTITPRPVASVLPRDPPNTSGFPVTTALTVIPWVREYSSINQAISRGPVPISGDGQS